MMLKKISGFALLLTLQQIQAQVTVNQFPDIGESFAVDAANYNEIDFSKQVKPTGGNQKWAFDGLTILGIPDTAYFLPPSLFNTGGQATGANLAVFDNYSPFAPLTYYAVTSGDQKMIGFSDDDSVLVKFETPFLVNKFPLNYLDEFGDMSKFEVPTPFGGLKTEIENFTRVDGWGEVKTPIGMHNCLRMKTTTTLQGTLLGIPFFNATIEEYKWISPGYDYELFRYTVGETEYNNEISNDTFAIYLADQIVSKTTNPVKPLSISVGPNPASETVSIEIPAEFQDQKVKVEIFDLHAKMILEQTIQGSKLELNVKSWERGVYMIKVSAGSRQWGLQKLVLQ